MISLKKKSASGFTIVELLIVIVVIGILAALVLNSFRGVQERARDTKRRTDVNSQASQLEVYYTDNGHYPLFSQVSADSFITQNFKGADLNAWRAPNQSSNSMTNSATPTKDQYGYQGLTDDGSGNATTTNCSAADASDCAHFKLFWKSEKSATVVEKDSLN
jgi:prepilin-type N-terminal cleavage/methylation domain-containing protein